MSGHGRRRFAIHHSFCPMNHPQTADNQKTMAKAPRKRSDQTTKHKAPRDILFWRAWGAATQWCGKNRSPARQHKLPGEGGDLKASWETHRLNKNIAPSGKPTPG